MLDFILDNIGIVAVVGYFLYAIFKAIFSFDLKREENADKAKSSVPNRRGQDDEKSLWQRRVDQEHSSDMQAAKDLVEEIKRQAAGKEIELAEASDYEGTSSARSFREAIDEVEDDDDDYEDDENDSENDSETDSEDAQTSNASALDDKSEASGTENNVENDARFSQSGAGQAHEDLTDLDMNLSTTQQLQSRLSEIYQKLDDIKSSAQNAKPFENCADTFNERKAYAFPHEGAYFKFNAGTLRDAIIASEVIAPPLALRQERETIF